MTPMASPVSRRTFLKTTTTSAAAGAVALSLPAAVAAEEKIALALVGCAHIHTPSFVNLLNSRPDVKVKYAWDHQIARAEKRGEDLGAKIVANADEIWQDPAVKGVVICSETSRHPALVKAAAAAKKHMFIEKPLGITAAESIAMAKAEGWSTKNGSKWKTMPELMLRYRAAAFFGRLYAPDVLSGMHSADEVEDVHGRTQTVDRVADVNKRIAKAKPVQVAEVAAEPVTVVEPAQAELAPQETAEDWL